MDLMKTLLLLLLGACTQASFTVYLPQYNVDKLEAAVLQMSDYRSDLYGQYWSIEEISDLISPPEEILFGTLDFVHSTGARCRHVRDALLCVGTQDQFRTVQDGLSYMVLGDEDGCPGTQDEVTPKRHGHGHGHGQGQGQGHRVNGNGIDPGYVGRETLSRLYNLSLTDAQSSDSVMSAEYMGGSGFSASDIAASQSANGQPDNIVTPDHVVGHNGAPDLETELDMQMQSQLADNVTLWYDASGDWLLKWALVYFNRPDVAYSVSHSWGWATDQQCTICKCKSASSEAYVTRVNVEFLKIAARGITMSVASGDSGAPGRSNSECVIAGRTVVPIFPGSSPWVLSVGATAVEAGNGTGSYGVSTPLCQQYGCANGTTERTINSVDVGWTAGGGFAIYDTNARPPWQVPVVTKYLDSNVSLPGAFNKEGRGFPDLTVVGHNCPTWSYGMLGDVDGTSCSSPTVSSIVAILNSHQLARGKPRLGLAAPIFYAMYLDDPSIFKDLTSGNNWCTEETCCPTRPTGGSDYGYEATVGWDPVTGLGTPNVGKMIRWLDVHVGQAKAKGL